MLVYGIIAAAIISQIFMVAAAVIGSWGLSGTLRIPTRLLVPTLMMFSVIGAFASRNALFDAYLMLACGAFGFLMKRTGYSPASAVMGLILSSIADNELIRILQLYGEDWWIAFLTRPVALAILAIMLVTLAWSGIGRMMRRRATARPG